jgi:DNA-binding transcriptional LysR family regulator
MNLRSIDLNLLVIFDALMTERHVTRAAARIAMSQPAMSNALSRLRHIFKDELFIRNAGRMEPTPRALELGDEVQQILRQVQRLMYSHVDFDPLHSEREFTARMSDLIGALVLPSIVARLRTSAPAISLNVLHMSPERTVQSLEADQLDFGISMELEHSRSLLESPLCADRMCCVMSADHPLASGKLTLQAFLKYPHLRVSMSPTDIRFVDNVLADRGLKRKIAINVPNWLLVPPTLIGSDLLAVVSERLARRFASGVLVAKPLPFESRPFEWTLYWHRRYDKSAPHVWMRTLVQEASAEL